MNNTGHFKLGMFSFFGYRLPLDRRLEWIKQAGFDTTAIWFGDEEPYVMRKEADSIPSLARKTGLEIENIHAPFRGCNRLWSPEKEHRDWLFSLYSSSIYFASRHSIPYAVFHVSNGSSPPPPNESGLELVWKLVELAQNEGIRLALENTKSPLHVTWLLEKIDSPFLGLCYDSSHDFLYSSTPCELLSRWGHRLFCTHFSDNDGKEDRHWIPTRGLIDWKKIINIFPATYTGTVFLEIFPSIPVEETLQDFLSNAISKARWLEDALKNSCY